MNNKQTAYYITDDYSVKYTDATKSAVTSLTSDELALNHTKFVAFREQLRNRGLLPADSNENDVVSFVQDRPGNRVIFYRVKAFSEYMADLNKVKYSIYNHANSPDLHLFQIHLQQPSVFGIAATRISKMAPERFAALRQEILAAGDPDPLKTNKYSHEGALKIIDLLFDVLSNDLTEAGVTPNFDRIMKFWTIQRYVELGHSVLPRATKVSIKDDKVSRFVFDLIDMDISLYTSFMILSRDANPHFHETKEFVYTTETIKEIADMPLEFLKYMLTPA